MSPGKRAREEALLADVGTKEENLRLLVNFVREREYVRNRKENNIPRPWTADPIIHHNHFCNIYRIDDLVSRWLLKHYYDPIMEWQKENLGEFSDLWFYAAIARLINWPPSLDYLMKEGVIPRRISEWDEDKFKTTFQVFKERGEKTFTGAYMLYNGSRTERNAEPKTFFTGFSVTLLIRHTNDLRLAVASRSLAKTSEVIQRVEGISTFLAGQIVADLTYLRGPGSMYDATDLYTWAPLGPGSQRGLNWLFLRRPIKKTWKEKEFLEGLMYVREQVLPVLPDGRVLTLHDVQNIMCEYSKYMRIHRTGESYRRYVSETAYKL